jgi:hypothetical protein
MRVGSANENDARNQDEGVVDRRVAVQISPISTSSQPLIRLASHVDWFSSLRLLERRRVPEGNRNTGVSRIFRSRGTCRPSPADLYE